MSGQCGKPTGMSMQENNHNFEAYVYAISEQVEQHITGLDELSDISVQSPLTFNQRSAAERSLQVMVEAAIGCSKHYLKSKNKPVPAEARASIERVYEILSITNPDIKDMRGAVGMRNAIIHDYLNLDWKKIEVVLNGKKYHLIKKYIHIVSSKLNAPLPG